MKKLHKIIFTAIGLCFLTASAANATGSYFSKEHPLSDAKAVKKTLIAPTEIIINNASLFSIYVYVPAGNFTDLVPSRTPDHIWNYQGAFDTYIVLKDFLGSQFWEGTVCPHASITVYSQSRSGVVVDSQACYH